MRLGIDLDAARWRRFRVLPSPVDRHQRRHRLILAVAAARWHEQKPVTELRRTVDPRAAACIEPKVEPVAVFQA